MSKYLKGELLVFTNRGLIRIDNIKKEDMILTINKENNYEYEEIEEITKIFKKKYKLNKIKISNYYDNYYINDNVEIKTIQNIPYNYDIKEINKYLEDNKYKCIKRNKIGELSDFDYIGFPLNKSLNNDDIKKDNDYYRYQGLIINNELKLNNEYDKSTIEFIEKYLNENNISYEIRKENITSIYKINEINKKISINDIFIMTRDELMEFMNGIIENSNELEIENNEIYKIIKFTSLFLGIAFSSYYKDGRINIKILKENKNNFIYENIVWNKIKSIKKIEYNGTLYTLKIKSKNLYLTELGFIS